MGLADTSLRDLGYRAAHASHMAQARLRWEHMPVTRSVIRQGVDRLGCARLAAPDDVKAYTAASGLGARFLPRDPPRNVLTPRVAATLTKLQYAFPSRFTSATVDIRARDRTGVVKTLSVIFFRYGGQIAAFSKVADRTIYEKAITRALNLPLAPK